MRVGGPAKLIEADVEPLVDGVVYLVVLVANLSRTQTLLHGFGFRGSPILVGSTYEQNIVIPQSAKPTKEYYVCAMYDINVLQGKLATI